MPRRLAPALAALGLLALLGLVAAATVAAGPGREASAGSVPAQPGVPARIVSLNPSLTAILVALGARDRLVGVDDFSARQQEAVAELPTVGGLFSPSLEAVVGLAPDLVVVVPSAEQRDFRARLAELGVPLLELDPVSFDEVLGTVETLGARVGREQAARERVAEVRRVRRAAEAATAALPRVRGVLVLQREPLFVAGRGSFVDEMLAAAGVENLGAAFPEPWPRASREWLIAAAPELILDVAKPDLEVGAFWARWPSLPAVRDGRVVPLAQGTVALPGPYLDQALRSLVGAAHGPEAARALDRATR